MTNRHEQYTDYFSMMTVHTDGHADVEIRVDGRLCFHLGRSQVEVLVQQLQDWLERTKI